MKIFIKPPCLLSPVRLIEKYVVFDETEFIQLSDIVTHYSTVMAILCIKINFWLKGNFGPGPKRGKTSGLFGGGGRCEYSYVHVL